MYIQQTRSDIYCSYLLLMKLLELRHCKQLLVLLWLNASSFSAVVLGVIRSHSLLQLHTYQTLYRSQDVLFEWTVCRRSTMLWMVMRCFRGNLSVTCQLRRSFRAPSEHFLSYRVASVDGLKSEQPDLNREGEVISSWMRQCGGCLLFFFTKWYDYCSGGVVIMKNRFIFVKLHIKIFIILKH